jgi:hypothetical protein
LGCDSLGTSERYLIDPFELIEFFDPNKDFAIVTDKKGNPKLNKLSQLFEKAKPVAYTHMTHMTKLFSMEPLEMGIMSTGIASIGNRTIKSLIAEFKRKDASFRLKPKAKNYTVNRVANKILNFIKKEYDQFYKDQQNKPMLEFIIGGYDKQNQIPTIVRVKRPENIIKKSLKDFGIVFGGQMKEIQSIVF